MTIIDEEIKTLAKQLLVRRHQKRYVGEDGTKRAVVEAATAAYADAVIMVETIGTLQTERIKERTRRELDACPPGHTRVTFKGGGGVQSGDGDAD